MTAVASEMLPSSRRAVPLRARDDLVVRRIEYRGEGTWVIKDPVGLKYHRLLGEQYCVLRALDGQRSLEEIRDELKREYPTLSLRLTDIHLLINDLHQKGLLYSDRPGQGAALLNQHRKERRKRLLGLFRNLLYLRLPGWDPERSLQKLYPLFRWMFRPWAVSAAGLLVLSAWVLLAVQFDDFRRRLPEFQQFFGWPNLIYMWITLGIAKIIHEFGHGLSCKHFGGECHEMGVMLLVFSPCLYCDVSDSWMLPNKWRRIIIGGAGMYVEVILSAIAIYVWWNTTGGLLHHLALNVFFVTTITTVIFNANPLMRFDGYYILSDLLEIPNLRPKADKMLRETFAWYCLGIESPPDPFMPQSGRVWFVLYAIAAAIYRWFLIFAIALFLYTVLKPYRLQSIGATLAVVSIGGILVNMVVNVYRILAAPRTEPMSYTKLAITLSVVAVLAAAVLLVPIPWHLEAACLLEPENVEHVYTSLPGRLKAVHVRPGHFVEKGQLLVELENPEKEDQYRALETEYEIQKKRVDLFAALGETAQLQVAEERMRSVEAERDELRRQLDQLTIVAPVSGWVVAPPHVEEPQRDAPTDRLKTWYGTPLDPGRRGAFLTVRTHLLSIAPTERYNAVLYVDQANRNDMKLDQPVELKFDHLPHRTYESVIKSISQRQLDYVPQPLSNKSGGEFATVTDADGRERLTSSVYRATASMEDDVHLLRTGMRGRARFLVDRRTAAQWLWRYLRRTFHFRL